MEKLGLYARISRELHRVHVDPVILYVDHTPYLVHGLYLSELLKLNKRRAVSLRDVARLKIYYKPPGGAMRVADVEPIVVIYSGPRILGTALPAFKKCVLEELLSVLRARAWVRDAEKPGEAAEILAEIGYYDPSVDSMLDEFAGVLQVGHLPGYMRDEVVEAAIWNLVHSDPWEDGVVYIARIDDEETLERIHAAIESRVLIEYRNTATVYSKLYAPADPRKHCVVELFPATREAEKEAPRRGYLIRPIEEA